jgi:hypothetical protein
MIRIMLPAHLRILAKVGSEVKVEVEGRATLSSVLDALEAQYPMLRGTLRDHVTLKRRPYVRFFACAEDLSHEPADTPLPDEVQSGKEPFLIVGAIAGGSDDQPAVSRKKLWTARIAGGFAILFLLMDALMKVVKAAPAVEGTVQLGYSADVLPGLGITLLLCTLLYAIPRTAVMGAILLTGYLGGAVATQVRVGNPLFSHVLFPVYVAFLIWGPLVLLDARVRSLVPLRK